MNESKLGWIFVFCLVFSWLFSDVSCQNRFLEQNPLVLSASGVSEYRFAELIRKNRHLFSSEQIAELKKSISKSNSIVEEELEAWQKQKIEWEEMWNTWVEAGDVHSVEKELEGLEKKVNDIVQKLSQDLKSIPKKGIYLCVLYDLDPFSFSNSNLQTLANNAIAPKAIEDLNGHLIESAKKISSSEDGQSIVSHIKDQVSGDLKISEVLFSQQSKSKTAFVSVLKLEVSPNFKDIPKVEGAKAAQTQVNSVSIDLLKIDTEQMQSLAKYEAAWPSDIQQILSNSKSEFLGSLKNQEAKMLLLFQSAKKSLDVLEEEISVLKKRRDGKMQRLNALQSKLKIATRNNLELDLQNLFQKLNQSLDNLFSAYLEIKSKEYFGRYHIKVGGERSLPEELASQSYAVVQQMTDNFEKGISFSQVNQLIQSETAESFSKQISRGHDYFRELDTVWLFPQQTENGWDLSVIASFKWLAKEGNRESGIKGKGKLEMEWVRIPAGSFFMGSPTHEAQRNSNEGPQRRVNIASFNLSKYEVTFQQYDLFCLETGRELPSDAGWGRGNLPVINVSWEDAKAFATWIGGRLPTEAEWEYACRAGGTLPFGVDSCLDVNKANYDANFPYLHCSKGRSAAKTKPVGSYPPNPWGLFDCFGNAYEWCEDWLGSGYYAFGENENPKGPEDGFEKVLRGGGWYFRGRNCRAAARYSANPKEKSNSIGFRVVLPD
jgi:formylglycine-generating enzyme